MATYVVGDIQGCLEPLQALLETVNFNKDSDVLISAGDLVNRGPQSLATLRFCMSLGKSFNMVLGNHDLHLLAIIEGVRKPNKNDTIQDILDAPDRELLAGWLRQYPLMLRYKGFSIVHAGIPHIWTIQQAQGLADEVSQAIQSTKRKSYFEHMYGNTPDVWHEDLRETERLRVITNYLTRMRFCSHSGELELKTKDKSSIPAPFKPWFEHSRNDKNNNIIFGHWAALKGEPCGPDLFAMDTGYVWGGTLRMMNLDTKQLYEQPQLH
ncbi:MAG: symmetrical bis(5'-nucleosyl)-tetraphosphatase [Porticoccaceae bacterium]